MKKLTKYFSLLPDFHLQQLSPHYTNDIWGRENNYAGQLVCKHKPDVVRSMHECPRFETTEGLLCMHAVS